MKASDLFKIVNVILGLFTTLFLYLVINLDRYNNLKQFLLICFIVFLILGIINNIIAIILWKKEKSKVSLTAWVYSGKFGWINIVFSIIAFVFLSIVFLSKKF